jgi:hypothetical protein
MLLHVACNSKTPQPAPQTSAISPLDHVDSAHVQPIHFLHQTFSLKKTAHFEFVVPAHTAIPRLHGTFRSFVPQSGGAIRSDDSTNVEFLLLSADQFSDFSRGRDGAALYTVDPTHDHEVDFVLSPTQEDSATYDIVFRNSSGAAATKVQANFALNFGYQ